MSPPFNIRQEGTKLKKNRYLCSRMEKRKVRFIINPISGTSGKQAIVKLIPRYLIPEKFEYDIEYTQYAGHAAEIAMRDAAQGVDIVVAVGGDGTVNEVARSLIHTQTALGIIPCGSGNGLARHLYIPMSAAGALRILAQGNIETLDYGIINEHPFFCTCGVGFDAFVSEKFAQSGKRGLLTYIENTLREGVKYKPETYEVEIDGESQKYKAFLIACGNASQYGNNAYITPGASMSDGLMDVTIMEPFSVIEAPQIAIQLFNKTINKNSRIKTFQCRELRIHREKEGAVHFDGDPILCGKELDIKLVERGISMVTNPKEQLFTPPLFRAFSDIYSDMTSEVQQIREDLNKTNQKIKTINNKLLGLLRRR